MKKGKNEKFKKMLLNDSYINWLSNFMAKEKEIDDVYFIHNHRLDKSDIKQIEYLRFFFKELCCYYIRNNEITDNIQNFWVICEDKYYELSYDGECYSCKVYDKPPFINNEESEDSKVRNFDNSKKTSCIKYEDLKKQYSIEQRALINNIIVSNLEELISKVLESPEEFYRKICEELTAEERMFIIKCLENKNCITCTNGSCNVESYEKVGFDESGKNHGCNCIGWYNAELIGKSKVLKITDIHKLK